MRFGVNYIPSKKWLHSWIDFDESSIYEDLQAIKALGFDHIRAHLIWSYFQPNENVMSDYCLNNLRRFDKICRDVGIDYVLSLFTGWMSGFYFFPAWIKRDGNFGVFSGKAEREAEKYYISQIASVVAESPVFLGFDLGNELTAVTIMDNNADISDCDRWQTEMLELCEELAPGKLHNNGVDNQPWFDLPPNSKQHFSRNVLSNTGAVIPLHCWTEFTGARERSGLLGDASIYLTDYMAQLARAYSEDEHKPVWIQEFGCSSLWLGEKDTIEEFAVKTLDVIADIPDCWGFTWWCSHDISEKFKGYGALEYDLGILDINNRPKPYAKAVSDWIKKYKENPVVTSERKVAMLYEPGVNEWINIDKYLSLISKGVKPLIILPQHTGDDELLRKKGITEIV